MCSMCLKKMSYVLKNFLIREFVKNKIPNVQI